MNSVLLVRRSRLRWIIVLVSMVAVGFGGYLGFVTFVETGSVGGLRAGAMGLAVATGFAAFFSPCSFPLLLTFLVRQYGSGSRRRAVMSSVIVGFGAVVFFGLLAVALALAGEGLGRFVGFDTTTGRLFRGVLGGFLVFLGLRQAHLIKARFRVLDTIAGAAGRTFDIANVENPATRNFVYGFGYVLAGFG